MKRSRKSAGSLKQTTLLQYSSPPKPRPSRKRAYYSSSSDSEDIQAIKLEKASSSDSDGNAKASSSSSNEDEPIPTPRRSKAKRKAVKSESEAEDSNLIPLKQRRPAKTQQVISDEDNAVEDRPQKRRRLTHRRTIVVHEVTDEDSSHNEADDLDSDCILSSRLRVKKQTAFQKNLERLKRRKQKQKEGISVSSNEDREERDESDRSSTSGRVFKGAKPRKTNSLFGSTEEEDGSDENNESDESDFIVEDDPLQAPMLPAQFSMETHQDLGHQFKKIFQLFVHVAVQPPKKRKSMMKKHLEDEYFSVSLTTVRRKLSGLRDSLVASSVWRPEFKKALEKYPDFELTHLDFTIPGCDACHLGSRLSTRRGALSGTPYDRLGFRELKGSGSDSDSEEELQRQFDLGRFCATRTEVFHGYCHWEYNTFKVVEREIDELKASRKNKRGGFYKIAYGGKKAPPEDLMDADGICEWLDERQIIDQEWRRVKELTDRAQKLEIESKRSGAQD